MSGILSAFLGSGNMGDPIQIVPGSYAYYQETDYVQMWGYINVPATGSLVTALWRGRSIMALVSESSTISAQRTYVRLAGLLADGESPERLRILNHNLTLTPYQEWGTAGSVTFSSSSYRCNWNNHGRVVGDRIMFTVSGGYLPSGIVAEQVYYVAVIINSDSFQFSATPGGAITTFSGSGSGTRIAYANPYAVFQNDDWLGSTNPFGQTGSLMTVYLA